MSKNEVKEKYRRKLIFFFYDIWFFFDCQRKMDDCENRYLGEGSYPALEPVENDSYPKFDTSIASYEYYDGWRFRDLLENYDPEIKNEMNNFLNYLGQNSEFSKIDYKILNLKIS